MTKKHPLELEAEADSLKEALQEAKRSLGNVLQQIEICNIKLVSHKNNKKVLLDAVDSGVCSEIWRAANSISRR